MKKLIRLSVVFLMFFLTSQITNAQDCKVEQITSTNGTMGKRTEKAVFIGQSFIACKTGKLTEVTFRIGGGNKVSDVALRVFTEKKIAKKPLFSQSTTIPTPKGTIKDFKDVTIKLENGGINLEEGKLYTVGFFKAKSEVKELIRFKSDNKNTYKEGSLVANSKIPGGKKRNIDVDMIFSFTIQ